MVEKLLSDIKADPDIQKLLLVIQKSAWFAAIRRHNVLLLGSSLGRESLRCRCPPQPAMVPLHCQKLEKKCYKFEAQCQHYISSSKVVIVR
jgi:hypothetical protein